MRRPRCVADLKAAHRLFERVVRLRHTLVLAHMIEPGVRKKGFEESALFGGVLVNAPVVGAVAKPLACIAADGVEKWLAVLGIDVLFDRHKDRS